MAANSLSNDAAWIKAIGMLFLIYLLAPNRKMNLTQTWCGALIAAVLLDIFLVLFPFYIRRCMDSFLGLILIFGTQINAYFFERHQSLPEKLATFTSQTLERLSKAKSTTLPYVNSYTRLNAVRIKWRHYHQSWPTFEASSGPRLRRTYCFSNSCSKIMLKIFG